MRCDFEKLYMLQTESLLECFARMLTMYNQRKRYEKKIEETHVVENNLCLLRDK